MKILNIVNKRNGKVYIDDLGVLVVCNCPYSFYVFNNGEYVLRRVSIMSVNEYLSKYNKKIYLI